MCLFQRLFTRVDGSVVSIRDYRFFHAFGTSKIYLDVLWQSQKVDLPPLAESLVGSQHTTGEVSRFPMTAGDRPSAGLGPTTQMTGHANVPSSQSRDPNVWSRVLPDVTIASGVEKHFELTLIS